MMEEVFACKATNIYCAYLFTDAYFLWFGVRKAILLFPTASQKNFNSSV